MPQQPPVAVLVNDDALALGVQARLLQRAGLEARPYGSVEAALAAMDPQAPPSLIVTDLYMPGIDGWRFCRLLRSPEFQAYNRVPILVVSATYAGDEPDRIAADLGAEAFLAAPVDGRLFVDQALAILAGRRLRTLPRALVVEDSRTLANLLKRALAAGGYQAASAGSLEEAEAAFDREPCEVAILDYHLPDGLGDALLDRFRSLRPGCVCLMMTTDPDPALALDWMKRGAADYLRKPFEPDYLVQAVGRARRERALLRVQDLLELRTRELRESEEKFRLIAENTSDGILTLDARHRILYASPALLRQLGHAPEAGFVLDTAGYNRRLHPEDLEGRYLRLGQAVAAGETDLRLGYRIRHHDGRWRHWEDHAKFIYGPAGEHLRSYVVCRDVTDRLQAEEEGALLQAQLMQAQKLESVGRLAGGVAHDFNNMLCVILGLSDLLATRLGPDHEALAPVQEIRRAAERSARLTSQLLAFARRQAIAPRVLDLNATVEDMLAMLRRLIGENIQVVWAPAANLGPVKVDPSQIDQVLANLCVNSRDAISGSGTVTIETGNVAFDAAYAANHPEVAPGEYVMLAVSDDGAGMDAETRRMVFEPFFTTKEPGKGTGLGLAMVYGIVKQNHGSIQVLSEPGRGTAVRIYLPRAQAPAALEAPPAPAPAAGGRETLLLVEDEPAILDMATRLLEALGYQVLAAPAAEAALRLARDRAEPIDLLLTDLILPGMNGRQLAEALRILHPGARNLFMSGYAAGVLEEDGVLPEGLPFLEKPFSMKDLAEKVRAALEAAPVPR